MVQICKSNINIPDNYPFQGIPAAGSIVEFALHYLIHVVNSLLVILTTPSDRHHRYQVPYETMRGAALPRHKQTFRLPPLEGVIISGVIIAQADQCRRAKCRVREVLQFKTEVLCGYILTIELSDSNEQEY